MSRTSSLRFCIEQVGAEGLSGWIAAITPEGAVERAPIVVTVNGQKAIGVEEFVFRKDLLDAGLGDGVYSFRVHVELTPYDTIELYGLGGTVPFERIVGWVSVPVVRSVGLEAHDRHGFGINPLVFHPEEIQPGASAGLGNRVMAVGRTALTLSNSPVYLAAVRGVDSNVGIADPGEQWGVTQIAAAQLESGRGEWGIIYALYRTMEGESRVGDYPEVIEVSAAGVALTLTVAPYTFLPGVIKLVEGSNFVEYVDNRNYDISLGEGKVFACSTSAFGCYAERWFQQRGGVYWNGADLALVPARLRFARSAKVNWPGAIFHTLDDATEQEMRRDVDGAPLDRFLKCGLEQGVPELARCFYLYYLEREPDKTGLEDVVRVLASQFSELDPVRAVVNMIDRFKDSDEFRAKRFWLPDEQIFLDQES